MIQLSVKAHGAEVVRQGLQDLSAEIPKIGRKGIYDKMLEVRKTLRTPGRKPSYPIRWVSERQRRAFFATGGFGGGIPHRRRGMEKRWNIVSLDKGYRFENPAPGAVYVFGDYEGARQSPIHEGRWPIFQETIESAIQEMPPEIERQISYYARGKGF